MDALSPTCDLRACLTAATAQSRAVHGDRPLEFRLVIDPRLPEFVFAKAEDLQISLENLLEQAISESSEDSFAILAYETDDANRSIIRFEIAKTNLRFDLVPEDKPSQPDTVAAPPLKILVAEDNPVNQLMAVECLHNLGYKCEVVANGQAAVEAAARTRYDLIFMDVHMPVMDGLQATREIRNLTREHPPYIAALTAYAMPGDRANCLDAGMDDYIAKPCRLKTLSAVLERAIATLQR